MSRLRHKIVARAALDDHTRARMLALMQLCYDNVDPARFAADLAEKQHVILLVDEHRAVQGFSTIRVARETLSGKPVDILFSGDTVIHPDCWGTKALHRGFLAFSVRHKLRSPLTPLYWLLLSKGYKTYLILTNNFPSAFPRRGATPAPELRALRDRVARAWWGDDYDAGAEVLRYCVPHDRVKHAVAPLDKETLAEPDVAFFADKNPGWRHGDELVCFAEIDFALGPRFFWKQLRRALGGRRAPLAERGALPRDASPSS